MIIAQNIVLLLILFLCVFIAARTISPSHSRAMRRRSKSKLRFSAADSPFTAAFLPRLMLRASLSSIIGSDRSLCSQARCPVASDLRYWHPPSRNRRSDWARAGETS